MQAKGLHMSLLKKKYQGMIKHGFSLNILALNSELLHQVNIKTVQSKVFMICMHQVQFHGVLGVPCPFTCICGMTKPKPMCIHKKSTTGRARAKTHRVTEQRGHQ